MKRLLFICSQNRLRSPTAEQIFSQYPDIEAISAGLNHNAVTPLSGDLLEWADMILVMEKKHKHKLNKNFPAYLRDKPIVVLGIPDKYAYMQPELVELLETKVSKLVAL